MLDFTYHNPVKIIFGQGKIGEAANEIPSDATILLLYGQGSIKKNGVYEQITAALTGRRVLEFGGIEPNPTYETAMAALEVVRANNVDFLLSVGGGSVLDATKFIAASAKFTEGDPWRILCDRAKVKDALPLGTILTLAATGSEMNNNSVISRATSKDKLYFASPFIYPKFSILDPTTTYSLPAHQTANGVVDAFVHVMEQYLTFPVDAPLQDRMAEGILLTLIEEGPKALVQPTDYNTRANIMWCATLALNDLIGQGVPEDWTTHVIGHEITAMHGLDHAVTLAIVLPAVMDARRVAKREKLLQYANRIWEIGEDVEEEVRIDMAIDKTRGFFQKMGIKTRFADYGLDGSSIPALVEKARRNNMDSPDATGLGERKDIGPDGVREILERCL